MNMTNEVWLRDLERLRTGREWIPTIHTELVVPAAPFPLATIGSVNESMPRRQGHCYFDFFVASSHYIIISVIVSLFLEFYVLWYRHIHIMYPGNVVSWRVNYKLPEFCVWCMSSVNIGSSCHKTIRPGGRSKGSRWLLLESASFHLCFSCCIKAGF